MSEWKEYKLGELGKIVTGKTPPTSQHQNYDGDIPFICIPDLGKSRFIFHTNKTISKIGLETVKNCSLPKGSVVVSCIATIGQVGITTKDISVTNQQINSLIPDSNLITEEFCYYYFKNLGEDLAQFGGGGSIFEIISKDKFSKVYLTIPSLPEQTAIASVLSSLDDKIDLLHRQNATLEKMGETLFRQWFVEDAKEEWESSYLGTLINIGSGKGLKKEDFIDNGLYPIFGANGIIGRTNKFLFNEKLIFTGRVGTLGNIFRIENEKVWLSDNTLVIQPYKYYNFVYFTLKFARLEDYNVGSTQPLIRQSDIKEIEISIPFEDMLLRFEEFCIIQFNKIKANQSQIRTLTTLRDTLLPKLMSGEIRVESHRDETSVETNNDTATLSPIGAAYKTNQHG